MSRARALVMAALFLAPAASRAGDALTGSLERETKRGTVAEKQAPRAVPVTATIEGLLMKGCPDAPAGAPCQPYYYIALPNQLGELMTGRTRTEAECKQQGTPMACAKGVQLQMREDTTATLDPLVGQKVSVAGVLQERHSDRHELPAVMRVETLRKSEAPKPARPAR